MSAFHFGFGSNMDNQAFIMLMAKLEDHDTKLDELLTWRYKLAGATLVVSAIVGIVTQIVINKVF